MQATKCVLRRRTTIAFLSTLLFVQCTLTALLLQAKNSARYHGYVDSLRLNTTEIKGRAAVWIYQDRGTTTSRVQNLLDSTTPEPEPLPSCPDIPPDLRKSNSYI